MLGTQKTSVVTGMCRQHTLRIPTGDIQDPVKRDLEKSLRERQLLCPTRLRTPPVAGKHTLSTVMWDKLDSTPCGHHLDQDGNYITKLLMPEELQIRKSDVVFDDYNIITGEEEHDCSLAAPLHTSMVCGIAMRLSGTLQLVLNSCQEADYRRALI